MSAARRKWSYPRAAALGVGVLLSLGLPSKLAAAEPERPSPGFFLDPSGKRVAFDPVYESWFGANRYRPNYLRAIAENAGVSLFEVAVYWLQPSLNVMDWQFPSLDSKLSSSEAFRFDDNLLRTNYLHHSTAGAAHYLLTRVNGFDVPGAFIASATASTAYELLLEWRELVSINDLIVTPFGGMALGEFLHQFGDYLNSEPSKVRTDVAVGASQLGRDAARVTLGLPRYAHNSLDSPREPIRMPVDNLGFSSAYWHEFRLHLAQTTAENARGGTSQLYGLRGEASLAAMPGFLRPGTFDRWYSNGNFASFELSFADSSGTREDEFVIDAHLAGWYGQSVRRVAGGLEGQAAETALASGLAYLDRIWAGQRDQYGIIHLPHPVQRGWLFVGPARISAAVDVSADFASVRSASYELYSARFGTDGTKSSLKEHEYFHGWGYSAGGAAAISLDALEVGASVRLGRYESLDGAERRQEEVTRDTHCEEEIRDFRVHLQLEPPGSVVSARLELRETQRASTLSSRFHANRTYRQIVVGLGLEF